MNCCCVCTPYCIARAVLICFIRFEKTWKYDSFSLPLMQPLGVVGDPKSQVEGVQHPTILVYLVTTCNWSLSSVKPLQHCCDHSPESCFSPQNAPTFWPRWGGSSLILPSWLQGVGLPEKGKEVEGKRKGGKVSKGREGGWEEGREGKWTLPIFETWLHPFFLHKCQASSPFSQYQYTPLVTEAPVCVNNLPSIVSW